MTVVVGVVVVVATVVVIGATVVVVDAPVVVTARRRVCGLIDMPETT